MLKKSLIYEDYYQDGQQMVSHPQTPYKNLILIFAESMEAGFADSAHWTENLIPNLSSLQKKYDSFSGYKNLDGTQWTLASQVSVLCGVPFKSLGRERLGVTTKYFMPSITCLPEILHARGYKTVFAKGCYKEFAGTDIFARERGFDEIWGRDELIENGFATTEDNGMKNFGINDRVFLNFARRRITDLSRQKEPFMIVLTTLDTHMPDGFVSNGCLNVYGDIRDAIKCSDMLIADFVKWAEKQPFMKNTVLAVIGDHPMMESTDVDALLNTQKTRSVFNMIVGKTKSEHFLEKRSFTQLDWGATLLDALGFENTGLGLGRSLLQNKETLAERFGISDFQEELLKRSDMYDSFLEP